MVYIESKLLVYIIIIAVHYGSCSVYRIYENNTECVYDEIVLLTSKNAAHQELNMIFQTENPCFNITLKSEKCPGGIVSTALASEEHKYVVNLRVLTVLPTNHLELSAKNLRIVNGMKRKNTNRGYESKHHILNSVHNSVVISKPVENLTNVYKVLLKFSEDHYYLEDDFKSATDVTLLNKILVCLSDETNTFHYKKTINRFFEEFSIHYHDDKDCIIYAERFKSKLIAILAPRPFDTPYETSIPMMFYQTPYFLPEYRDSYPNSFALMKTWQPLKYAFLNFLEQMDWKRIAIISDDSPYSEAFERELTSLFNDKGFLYIVKACTGRICDFKEAIIAINQTRARIIIANVDNKYAWNLTKIARNHNVISRQGYMWIVRDWSFNLTSKRNIGELFSIALGPIIDNTLYRDKLTIFEKHIPILTNVVEGITRIRNGYCKCFSDGFSLDKQTFYRNLANNIRDIIDSDSSSTCAYVKKFTKRKETQLISSMLISRDNVAVLSFKYPFEKKTSDLPGCFILRSNNFYKPCNDYVLVIEIFVIVIMFLMAYIIYVYFDELSHQPQNYDHL